MGDDQPGDDWLPTGSAAEILGVSTETVRTYADTGQLIAKRTPYGRLISASDVQRLRAERQVQFMARRVAHEIDREAALIRKASKGLPSDIANPLKEHTRAIQAKLREVGPMDAFKGIEPHLEKIEAIQQVYSGVFSDADRYRAMTGPLLHIKDQMATLTNVQAVFTQVEQFHASTKALTDKCVTDSSALLGKMQVNSYATDPFGVAGDSFRAMDQASKSINISAFDVTRQAISSNAFDKRGNLGGLFDQVDQGGTQAWAEKPPTVGEFRLETLIANQALISPRRSKSDPRIDELMVGLKGLREEMAEIKEMLQELLNTQRDENK